MLSWMFLKKSNYRRTIRFGRRKTLQLHRIHQVFPSITYPERLKYLRIICIFIKVIKRIMCHINFIHIILLITLINMHYLPRALEIFEDNLHIYQSDQKNYVNE